MVVDYKQSTRELAQEWDKLDIARPELIKQADQRRRKADIDEAIELYTRGINLAKPKETYERSIARVGLGICCLLQEPLEESNLQKAKKSFASAAKSFRGEPATEGVALLFLCLAQQAQGTPESLNEALRTCMQAERTLEGEALEEKARQRVQELSALVTQRLGKGSGSSADQPSPSPRLEDLPQFDPVELVRIPILGEIAAGPLMLAEEHIQGFISLREDRARGIDFALQVKGNSMAGAGIKDGDTVFIRSQSYAAKGDIVVAMVGDQMSEFALKRFYFDDHGIHLWSEPSTGQREEFQSVGKEDARKVQVLGKVITM